VPPGIALTGAYHGEDAPSKGTCRKETCAKQREKLRHNRGTGHKSPAPTRPVKWARPSDGWDLLQSPERKGLRRFGPGGLEPPSGPGPRFASRLSEVSDERAATQRARMPQKGLPAGQGTQVRQSRTLAISQQSNKRDPPSGWRAYGGRTREAPLPLGGGRPVSLL
jgi:hypothetical protein